MTPTGRRQRDRGAPWVLPWWLAGLRAWCLDCGHSDSVFAGGKGPPAFRHSNGRRQHSAGMNPGAVPSPPAPQEKAWKHVSRTMCCRPPQAPAPHYQNRISLLVCCLAKAKGGSKIWINLHRTSITPSAGLCNPCRELRH